MFGVMMPSKEGRGLPSPNPERPSSTSASDSIAPESTSPINTTTPTFSERTSSICATTMPLPEKSGSISTGSSSTTKKQISSKVVMLKFFKKSPRESQALQEEANEDTGYDVIDDRLRGLVHPSPFMKPLEHKLEARGEPLRDRSLISRGHHYILNSGERPGFDTEGNRDQGVHRFRVNRSDEGLGYRYDDGDLSTSDDLSQNGEHEHIHKSMSIRISQQLESIAVASSLDDNSVSSWRIYIDCYSKGQFNLNNLPPPPPCRPSFEYLPAIFPGYEEERILSASSFNVVWPQWSQDKAGALIRAAMKKFGTRSATFSIFNSEYEVFKAELGYNGNQTPRSTSIAAHALLSTDVFVVLDTKQDWRFKGNPLVSGKPKIRFFAGAPMLSTDGHPVGVFAVFGREPRAAFTFFQRRELAEFASLIMTDLNLQAEYLSDPELRSTPLLQRDSIINGGFQPSAIKFPGPNEIKDGLIPPALSYHKSTSPSITTSLAALNSQQNRDVQSENTPPSSPGGSQGPPSFGSTRGFGKNYKELSVISNMDHPNAFSRIVTPDSDEFRTSSPRPFSVSDVTSFYPHPPNTPTLPGDDDLMTVENFMSLSDEDCAEDTDGPLIDLSPRSKMSKESQHLMTQSDASQTSFLWKTASSKISGEVPEQFMTTVKLMKQAMDDQSHRSTDITMQAAFACATFAHQLGCDLIYVVDMKPLRAGMTDQELVNPGGLDMQILVAHGLDPAVVLSPDVHLRILRGKGYEQWSHKPNRPGHSSFKSGCLIPLYVGGNRQTSSRGIILGAFKVPTLIELDEPDRFKARDLALLVNASSAVQYILKKSFSKESITSRRKRAETPPQQPAENKYLANEAVEIGDCFDS